MSRHFNYYVLSLCMFFASGAIPAAAMQQSSAQTTRGMQQNSSAAPHGAEPERPIKCGTPLIIQYHQHPDQLSPSAAAKVSALRARTTQAQHTYTSPSGKFKIFYDTSGNNAIPTYDLNSNGLPDYVEWVATAADSSWKVEVEKLGYTDPVTGSTSTYPIYLEYIGFYGYTDYGANRGYPNSTFIVVNSDLDNPVYATNDDFNKTYGAIKVTVAHELKHAIQYAATGWTGESDKWAEMDATLMEETVYDTVNDYYHYLEDSSSIFINPQISFYPGSYYHVTWALYFRQKFGDEFWVNVWKRLKAQPLQIKFSEAISEELNATGSGHFGTSFLESELWHFAASPANSLPNYGFSERYYYPVPTVNYSFENFSNVDSLIHTGSIDGFSANYVEVSSSYEGKGNVTFKLKAGSTGVGIAYIIYPKTGPPLHEILPVNSTKPFTYVSPLKWEEIKKIRLIVGNSNIPGSQGTPPSYTLQITSSIPDEITLSQNYPNPFNPSTTISFGIDKQTHVQLKVYDITGRLVQTLRDEVMQPNIYKIPFDAQGLASGVYVYRLVTDSKSITKKMTFIK